MIYQDANFKICLSLLGWKENILPKVHIVHWADITNYGMFQSEDDTKIFRYFDPSNN